MGKIWTLNKVRYTMATMQMKTCSISLITKKMQIKPQWGTIIHWHQWLKLKTSTTKDVNARRNVHFLRKCQTIFNTELYDPTISLVGVYSRETQIYIHPETCTWIS